MGRHWRHATLTVRLAENLHSAVAPLQEVLEQQVELCHKELHMLKDTINVDICIANVLL